MPPKKAPIYCLVHGNPESSVFRIKYDKNMTIDELRKVIWKEKIEVPEHVKAKDLILYQVDINLNTQNLKRTALGNQDANIVNDLGGQVLSPMDTIKEIFPVLANKHIYIIVCVPDVAIRRNDDVIIARLDKLDQNVDRIDKNIEDIKREKSSQIRSILAGAKMTTREIEFPTLNFDLENERIDAFGWIDAIEKSQNDSTNTDILQIRLSGTTDLVIVDRHSIASQAQENISDSSLRKIIMRLKLTRTESVVLIRNNLISANKELIELANQAFEPTEYPAVGLDRSAVIQESSQIDIESSYSKEELPPKRQKLRHVIATSNVSSDIDLMEGFFDTMSEEEIFRYKAKQILT
ncbi:hypothetical protein GLOIN_2v1770899 [Rhizophagus irregularis DAOM 181602=DAOM 197198]|uniref:Crinkler effector protein N-terminal domain-containing protein n=1 Tax=Rhizophagus irregularis (strain DAOM 181602 / DAOM 197198 / MUCL 43194) TaxID=747089 RepID=A0A2P4QB26_RHIID|nr:hypothetical protein GLOIN_2v1770899 [Rhizophagus irregularis DAOM 181602=DAOM 197198]POG74844.1 hypothetical protein GLOIN_2v1770899 [Rhizophagus irregularis DAOM 181602=DAOM 197198]|eukprot:XP_025181710.1 hypothetical protein GLOIN_2v1770899 [Rhizophagus irregularis DAOM 181602=DAOM 197198]